jgi:hypothetical protein
MKTPTPHPLNVSYLVVGLVFLGIAGFWALRVTGTVDQADGRWLAPLLLVAAGAAGLVGFAAKGARRARRTRRDELTGGQDDDLDAGLAAGQPFDPYPIRDDEGDLR